jgi:hypothetical protein
VSRDRGYIDRRKKLRDLPYVLEVPRPERIGLWRELDDINAWCRARCGVDGYATSSREDRSGPGLPRTILLVHFAAEQDARAFALAFGLSYRPRS